MKVGVIKVYMSIIKKQTKEFDELEVNNSPTPAAPLVCVRLSFQDNYTVNAP